MVDYHSLPVDELLTALEQAGRTPDLDLVRACLERREELTPSLLEMLAGGVDEDWELDDPRWYREVHAGLLLIAFREPAALPIFAEIFRDQERENLVEWFSTKLPTYGPAATQMVIDLLNDDSAYEFARFVSTEMLAAIAFHHPGERERVLEALRPSCHRWKMALSPYHLKLASKKSGPGSPPLWPTCGTPSANPRSSRSTNGA